MLVTFLALGQCAIEAGDYRDISDFLADMDEENHREHSKRGRARRGVAQLNDEACTIFFVVRKAARVGEKARCRPASRVLP